VSDLRELGQLRLLFAPLGNAGSLKAHLIEAAGDRLFLGEDASTIRTRAEFEERVNAAWGKLGGTVATVAKEAMQILKRRQQVGLLLDKPVPDILTSSVGDMREQLQFLVPPDFLVSTPALWLPHLPRYLAGIEIRHKKLLDAGLDRDSRSATAIHPFWKAWLDRVTDADADPPGPRWSTFHYLIEEYRVSLFAQNLGTATKVSPKVLADWQATLRE
jgi:ATP-dependent helicase HrpA